MNGIMTQNNNSEAVDSLLFDMRQHVSSLQDKLSVANSAVTKGQNINEKIAIMKEYQEKVATLNSCWRSKNRTSLVANLQQENRQIIALEQENRQLRFALKEMEDGMHLIMNDYRRHFSEFMKSNALFDLAKSLNEQNPETGIDYDKYLNLARASEQCLAAAEQKIAEDDELIAQLRLENQNLRSCLLKPPNK